MTRFWDYLQLGLLGIASHRLRSALTGLGVALGIAALMTMMAVGEGARVDLLERMKHLGLNNITVSAADKTQAKTRKRKAPKAPQTGLLFKDYHRCKAALPYLIDAHAVREVKRTVQIAGRPVPARVLGVSGRYFDAFPYRLERGRMFCPLDDVDGACVCLLEAPLSFEFCGARDPLQLSIDVGGTLFRVVGLVQRTDSPPQEELESRKGQLQVWMPLRSCYARFGWTNQIDYEEEESDAQVELDRIVLQCSDPLAAVGALEYILNMEHAPEDYALDIPLAILKHRSETQQIFNRVLLLIALITLIVGGTGIVNIMLVSVVERTREIGIRRAIGARGSDILLQFLIETMGLTVLSGLAGIAFGAVGAQLVGLYTGWPITVSIESILIGFAVSVGAGVIFGLIPAYRASKTHPAVVLRYS